MDRRINMFSGLNESLIQTGRSVLSQQQTAAIIQRRLLWTPFPDWEVPASSINQAEPSQQGLANPLRLWKGFIKGLDFKGPFPRCIKGCVYSLNVVGCFLKWTEVIPLREVKYGPLLSERLTQWEYIVLDPGPQFTPKILSELGKMWGGDPEMDHQLPPNKTFQRETLDSENHNDQNIQLKGFGPAVKW